MGTSSTLGLLLEISADPTKAQGAVRALEGQTTSWAERMKGVYAELGIDTEAWAANAQRAAAQQAEAGAVAVEATASEGAGIRRSTELTEEQMAANRALVQQRLTGYRETAAAAEREIAREQTFAQTIRSNFAELTALRRAMYATFGLVSFVYLIPEINKVVQGIERMSLAIGGFSTAAQDAFTAAGKAYDQFFEHLKGADYTRKQLESVQIQIAQVQRQLAEATKAGVADAARTAAGMAGMWSAPGTAVLFYDAKVKALENTLTDLNAQEAKLSVQLGQEVVGHGKATESVTMHGHAVNVLWAAENNRLNVMHAAHAALLQMAKDEDAASASAQRMAKSEFDAAMMNIELATDNVAAGQRMRQMTIELMPPVQILTYSQRELHLAIQQLTRDYPQLTAAEVRHLAQMKLADPAYRQVIDDMSRHGAAIRQQRLDWQMLSQQVRTSISEITGALTGWGGVAGRVFDQMANQIMRQIELDKTQAATAGIAQASMTGSVIKGLKTLAPVQAVWNTAKAVEMWARWAESWFTDEAALAAAGHYTLAAAEYGLISGVSAAALVGSMGGGGGRGTAVSAVRERGAAVSAGGTPAPLAPGAAGALGAGGAVIVLNLDGQEFARAVLPSINRHVERGGGRLVSSHTLRPVPAGA